MIKTTLSSDTRQRAGEPIAFPGLTPLPASDRAGTVMKALADFIALSGLKPGERLPTERELMQALAVGRSTVREVIRQFQALGVMESRKGSGTYLLRGISSDTIHMPLQIDASDMREGLLATLDIRRGLEAEAGALAAVRRTEADLATIEERLIELERVHRAEGTSGEADLAFHLAVYDASHNPMFGQLLEQMRGTFQNFWTKPFNRPDFANRSHPMHRKLFEAIAAQDADRARRETLAILEIVEEDIREMSQDTAPHPDKVMK